MQNHKVMNGVTRKYSYIKGLVSLVSLKARKDIHKNTLTNQQYKGLKL